MKKLVTLQGKKFKLSDISLYKVVKNGEESSILMAYVHDPEQTKIYKRTRETMKAPIWLDEYTEESEMTILGGMKHIVGYIQDDMTKEVLVTYENGDVESFEEGLLDEVKDNLRKQRNLDKHEAGKIAAILTEEEKTSSKASTKKKVNRGIAGFVATMLVSAGLGYGISKLEGCNYDEPISSTPSITSTPQPTATIIPVTYSFDVNNKKELKEQVEKLCSSVNNNAHVLTYQQDAKLNIDEKLATEIIEVLNGQIPSTIRDLDGKEFENAMGRILTNIEAISWTDTRAAIDGYTPVNLHSYIANSRERELVESAVVVARDYLHATIGEPWAGNIIGETATEETSHEFLGFASELLDHEYKTIAGSEYVQASNISKFLVSTVYRSTNAAMPLWAYVGMEKSESTTREHTQWGMYYMDSETRKCYYPEEKDAEVIYVYTRCENDKIVREEYTLNEMEKWASENVNIVPRGIFTDVDLKNEYLRRDLLEGRMYFDGVNYTETSSLKNAM